MKTRRVMVILEVETDAALSVLRRADLYELWRRPRLKVLQAQANVIREKKRKARRKA